MTEVLGRKFHFYRVYITTFSEKNQVLFFRRGGCKKYARLQKEDMIRENITAMVSCFARAYHTGANACPVFSDTAARALRFCLFGFLPYHTIFMHRPSRISGTYADTFIKKRRLYVQKKSEKAEKSTKTPFTFSFRRYIMPSYRQNRRKAATQS